MMAPSIAPGTPGMPPSQEASAGTGHTAHHGVDRPSLVMETDDRSTSFADLFDPASPTTPWTILGIGGAMVALVLWRHAIVDTATAALCWTTCLALWMGACWRHSLRPFLEEKAFARRLPGIAAAVAPRTEALLYPWLRAWLLTGDPPDLWTARTDWRITPKGLVAEACEVSGLDLGPNALGTTDPKDHPYFPSMAPGTLCVRWSLATGRWDAPHPHDSPAGDVESFVPWAALGDGSIVVPRSLNGRRLRFSTETFAGPRSAHARVLMAARFSDRTGAGKR